MQRRDAVDLVRADKGEVAHADMPALPLVDYRDRGVLAIAGAIDTCGLLQVLGIDAVDDVEVARQEALEEGDRPILERLRQQRMVRVGKGADGDTPRDLDRKSTRLN